MQISIVNVVTCAMCCASSSSFMACATQSALRHSQPATSRAGDSEPYWLICTQNVIKSSLLLIADLPCLNAKLCFIIHCVLKKLPLFCFYNNSVKRGPISKIFGIRSPEETLRQMVVNLSTSPKICHCTTLWNFKKWFFKYITHRLPSILAIFQ